MSWIPRREIYCSVCRRMVAAVLARPGVLVPAGHYRFTSNWGPGPAVRHARMAYQCPGSGHVYAGEPGMDHGQEDRLAAWRTSPYRQAPVEPDGALEFWRAKT